MTGAVLLAAALTLLNGVRDLLPVLAAAFVHECGHMLACLFLRVPVRSFRPIFAGARIGYDATALSYTREIIIAAAGPAANLLSAAAMLCFTGRAALLFGASSLALALFNLMPQRQLDGGVILSAVLHLRFGVRVSMYILRIVYFLSAGFLWMCAVAVQLRCGGNLSFLLVSVYLLLSLSS